MTNPNPMPIGVGFGFVVYVVYAARSIYSNFQGEEMKAKQKEWGTIGRYGRKLLPAYQRAQPSLHLKLPFLGGSNDWLACP